MNKFRLLIAILAITASSLPLANTTALAESSNFSDVMDDLTTALNFDASDFPLLTLKDDYSNASISLIDLKENVRGEVILYVYNPTGAAEANKVNISPIIQDPVFTQYDLTLVSASETNIFQKYLVEGLEIDKKYENRFYLVSSIYRKPFNIAGEAIPDDKGQTASAIAYSVGKLFRVNNYDEYSVREQKVIVITDKLLASMLCETVGISFFVGKTKQCISFVTFNTDMTIDDLYEIEINYDLYDYTVIEKHPTWEPSYIDEDRTAEYTNKVEIRNQVFTSEDKYDINEGWWTNTTHKVRNIARNADLLNEDSEYYDKYFASHQKKSELNKYAWTLFFYSTDYTKNEIYNSVDGQMYRINTRVVKDMTILRLKFISDGVVYNLGAVDDVSSGPSNPLTPDAKTNWLLILIMIVVLACVLVALLPQLIMSILGAFFKFINFLAKGLVAVVKAPFKAAGKAFKNRKSRRKY